MKYLFMLSVLGLSCASAFATTQKFPSVTIPSITFKGEAVRILHIKEGCIRAATIWEELNNGLDHFVSCDVIKMTPSIGTRELGIVVKANEKGEFIVPAIHFEFASKKLLKSPYACLYLSAVEEIRESQYGDYPINVAGSKEMKFCNKDESITLKTKNPTFKDYEKTLKKGLEFEQE